MFAIPRLAIVCGLLIFPHGPLNVDRDNSDFPELFRPFKNLLRKIRDLLLTLTTAEFHVLEKLLCQLEEPTDLERKLKAAALELEEKSRLLAGEDQAAKLDERLSKCLTLTTCDNEAMSTASAHQSEETSAVVNSLLNDILEDVIKQSTKNNEEKQETSKSHKSHSRKSSGGGSSKMPTAVVEIDCTGPDITVTESGDSPGRRRQRIRVVDPETGHVRHKHKSSRRKGTKKYPRSGKDARARFKSSEDLIHRLYVCISGAADQLQTNFAGDFRSILKYVFIMNSSQEEEEEEDIPETDEKSQESLSDTEDNDLAPELSPDAVSLENPETEDGAVMIEGRSQSQYECGEDALMTETEQEYLRSLPRTSTSSAGANIDPRLLSTSPPAGLAAMPVYASNLDYHMGESGVLGGDTDPGTRFYQPEPTLLTIASGDMGPREEQEQGRSRNVEAPPAWIPDSMAPLCMGCGAGFSLVKRRHHCRSCGRVFCAKCSPNQVPLPRYGIQKAVRVCNRCYIYYMNPYEERTAHAYHVYSGTGHGSWGYSGMVT